MGIIRICFMAVKGLELGFRPEDCCLLPLQISVVHLRREECGCGQVAGEVSGFFEMGFGFNSLIRKRNSVDMEPAAVNKNRDKFLFLQVCEVQYSNPSDIFRRAPLQRATAQEPTVCPGMETWLLEYGRSVPAGFSVQPVKANPRETFVCGGFSAQDRNRTCTPCGTRT